MPKKRTSGDGSIIFVDGREKPWRARSSRANGRTAQNRFFTTKAEASAWLRGTGADIDAGTRIDPSKTTLAQWFQRWLEVYIRPSVRIRTYEGYADMIRLHINPALGHIPIQALTPADLQGLLNSKAEEGYARRTLVYILSTIRPALKQAMLEGLVNRNISDAVKVPKGAVRPPAKQALTRQEIQAIQNAIENQRLSIAFRTLANTGMRIGEMLALTWDDIDNLNSRILIKKAITATQSQGIVIGETKTESSNRDIPVSQNLLDHLKAWKGYQTEERLAAGREWTDHGNIIFTMEFGTRIRQEWLSNTLRKTAEKLNIYCTPHILRHSYASLLIQGGVDPKTVQKLLGHSTPRTVMEIYAHSSDEAKRKAINVLGL